MTGPNLTWFELLQWSSVNHAFHVTQRHKCKHLATEKIRDMSSFFSTVYSCGRATRPQKPRQTIYKLNVPARRVASTSLRQSCRPRKHRGHCGHQKVSLFNQYSTNYDAVTSLSVASSTMAVGRHCTLSCSFKATEKGYCVQVLKWKSRSMVNVGEATVTMTLMARWCFSSITIKTSNAPLPIALPIYLCYNGNSLLHGHVN